MTTRRNFLRGGIAAAAIAGTATAAVALTSSELDRLIAELAIARAEVDKYDATPTAHKT